MQKSIRQFGVKQKYSLTNIKWSPHDKDIFAVSSAANFTIVGNGTTQIKAIKDTNIITIASLLEKDAVFDISWFELNNKYILIGLGNGQISFWQIGKNRTWINSISNSEINSIQCSLKNPLFICGRMDGTLSFGTSENGNILSTYAAHHKNCNQVQWHPTSQNVAVSVGGDGMLKFWDYSLSKPNISTSKAHDAEIISVDFHKYSQQIVTSSLDKSIRLWDLRNLSLPINIFLHHRYPAKKVRFSPHYEWLLGSCSYDMNVHFYDLRDPIQPLKFKASQHTEFVSGLDFNLFHEKMICSVGWDGRILIWDFDQPQPIIT